MKTLLGYFSTYNTEDRKTEADQRGFPSTHLKKIISVGNTETFYVNTCIWKVNTALTIQPDRSVLKSASPVSFVNKS